MTECVYVCVCVCVCVEFLAEEDLHALYKSTHFLLSRELHKECLLYLVFAQVTHIGHMTNGRHDTTL